MRVARHVSSREDRNELMKVKLYFALIQPSEAADFKTAAVGLCHGLRCWQAPWLPTRGHHAEYRAHYRGRSSGLAAGGSLAPRWVGGRAGAAVRLKRP